MWDAVSGFDPRYAVCLPCLKSGDFNLPKVDEEILYKKKIFLKQQPTEKLLSSIEHLAKEERILKHSPRFAVVTDYKN